MNEIKNQRFQNEDLCYWECIRFGEWGHSVLLIYNVASSLNLITGHIWATMKDLKILIKPFCLLHDQSGLSKKTHNS